MHYTILHGCMVSDIAIFASYSFPCDLYSLFKFKILIPKHINIEKLTLSGYYFEVQGVLFTKTL